MYSRNVPAMDSTTKPQIWNLTTAQWSVYYWLLAHSKRNPSNKEPYYYIYRNSFSLKQIRNQTGVKSDNTIRQSFEVLNEKMIIICDESKNVFYIYPPLIYVPMSTSIICALLAFNKYLNPGVTITMLAIFARLSKFPKKVELTKTEIAALLGKAKQHIDEAGVVLSLYLLKGLELIDFSKRPYKNRMGVECVSYRLEKVNIQKSLENFFVGDNFDSAKIEEYWAEANANGVGE